MCAKVCTSLKFVFAHTSRTQIRICMKQKRILYQDNARIEKDTKNEHFVKQQNQHKVTTHKTTHVCITCLHYTIAKAIQLYY